MENIRTKDALGCIFRVVYAINNLLQQSEPWKLIKTNPTDYKLVMYTAIECLRIVGILLIPFIPTKSRCILRQLGIPEESWAITPATMKFGWLQQGIDIGTERENLFQKFEIVVEPAPKPEKKEKPVKEKKPKQEKQEKQVEEKKE